MIYYTNDNFISFSEKPRKAVSKESFASIEEPIFTRFIVGDVKNVFFKNNRRCRTTSASAGDSIMKETTNKSWSVDSEATDFHRNGSQHSLRASKKSAGYEYKPNEEVAKEKTCVVKANEITVLTTEQSWNYETYLISRFIRLKGILGRGPELVDLYYAGFSREEIDLVETLTDGIVSDDLEEWEPISRPIESIIGSGVE